MRPQNIFKRVKVKKPEFRDNVVILGELGFIIGAVSEKVRNKILVIVVFTPKT